MRSSGRCREKNWWILKSLELIASWGTCCCENSAKASERLDALVGGVPLLELSGVAVFGDDADGGSAMDPGPPTPAPAEALWTLSGWTSADESFLVLLFGVTTGFFDGLVELK